MINRRGSIPAAAWADESKAGDILLAAIARSDGSRASVTKQLLTTHVRINGLAPYRGTDGSYRLENEYHYLIARA